MHPTHDTIHAARRACAGLLVGASTAFALCAVGCGVEIEDAPANDLRELTSSTPSQAESGAANAGLDALDAAVALPPRVASSSAAATFTAAKTSGPKCQSTATISPDGKEISIWFEDFTVALTADRGINSGACNVTLDLDVPAGHAVAIEQLEADATAELGPGVVGSVESSFSFLTSLGRVAASASSVTGPFRGGLAYRGEVAPEKQLFSSCGKEQRLTAHLRLALVRVDGSGSGSLALNRLKPAKLALRRCD